MKVSDENGFTPTQEQETAMKIAIIAANGRAGRLITAEAVRRGHDVTAIVRSENKTDAPSTIQKDILDLTAEDLAGFEVAIDAFGTWDPEKMSLHTDTVLHLADILSGTDTRLLVVGGAGSLYVNPEHTVTVADAPDFPTDYLPTATAMAASLAKLRARDDVRWTYLSPAADFQADGERTGAYLLAGEEFTLNTAGESVISYADYAIAMLDEAERTGADAHVHERISVVRR